MKDRKHHDLLSLLAEVDAVREPLHEPLAYTLKDLGIPSRVHCSLIENSLHGSNKSST